MLKTISNSALLNASREIAKRDREITKTLLEHINEVDRRRLWVSLDYRSLQDWLVKDLKYDDSTASRHRAAAAAIRSMPELADKIADGSIGITNLTNAQHAIRRKEVRTGKTLPVAEQRAVIAEVQKLSTRQAQEKLAEIFPESAPQTDVVKYRNAIEVRVHVTFTKTQLGKLERLAEILSHKLEKSDSRSDLASVIEAAADELLRKIDPLKREVKARKTDQIVRKPELKTRTTLGAENRTSTEGNATRPRKAIKTSVQNQIFRKYGGRCSHVDIRGERCSEKRLLQTDHIIAVARGGTGDPENLTLLCRRHNLLKAERDFGRDLMSSFCY